MAFNLQRMKLFITYLQCGQKTIANKSKRGNQSCDSLATQSSTSFSAFFKMHFCKEDIFKHKYFTKITQQKQSKFTNISKGVSTW